MAGVSNYQRNGRHHLGMRPIGIQPALAGALDPRWGGHDDNPNRQTARRVSLILVDEACGVPKSIFDAVDALATNSNARVLAIGNPDDPLGHHQPDLPIESARRVS